MRILIVRHGDPDYSIDSLTEKGWKEAELLSHKLSQMDITKFYVSPLGRAKDTASFTLKRMNREATECKWLQEFPVLIWRPDRKDRKQIIWDWLPQDWTTEPRYYDYDSWYKTDIMKAANAEQEYRNVTEQFDRLLEKHGYVREGNIYRAVHPNRDTIVLFCHFGLECVLLSYLMHISPMILWHTTCAAPTSVTSIYTEERREGIASLRINAFGDISHLYAEGEEPAFAARFCETYDSDERHD